jgi:hypothetical protein
MTELRLEPVRAARVKTDQVQGDQLMKALVVATALVLAAPNAMAEDAGNSAPDAGNSAPGVQPAPGVGKAEKAPTLDAAGPNITASDPEKGSQSSGENAADIAKGEPGAEHGQKDQGNTATPSQDTSGQQGPPDTRTGPASKNP